VNWPCGDCAVARLGRKVSVDNASTLANANLRIEVMESPVLPVADKTHGHRLKSTLPRANRGGMGSDFGGDRRGQGICSVAYADGMQTAASKRRQTELVFEVTPLCNRSGAAVQRKKSIAPISAPP
jgi:hypothetical protein